MYSPRKHAFALFSFIFYPRIDCKIIITIMAYPLYPSILPFLFFSFFFFLAPMIPIRDTCGEINRELQFILHAEWWNFYSTFLCKTRVRHKRTNRWDGIRISTIISSSVSTGLFYLSVYPRIESFTFLFFFFFSIYHDEKHTKAKVKGIVGSGFHFHSLSSRRRIFSLEIVSEGIN